MKESLTKLCWPILRLFETDQEVSGYKASHRTILIVFGSLFVLLGLGCGVFSFQSGIMGGLIPFFVFLGIGKVAIIVGLLGSDAAVSKLWGTK